MNLNTTRLKEGGIVLLAGGILLWVSSLLGLRFDLTGDGRFTLSEASTRAVRSLRPGTVEVDVLLGEELPGAFALLRQEVAILLEQYDSRHGSIRVSFFDPLQDEADPEQAYNDLLSIGISPFTVTEGSATDVSQKNVFPWAVVTYQGRSVRVPLLRKAIGTRLEERVDLSIQELEYAFADAFRKLGIEERKRLGLIDGQGEFRDRYIGDFMGTASEYYDLVRISMDSSNLEPEALLDSLRSLDALLIAKPVIPFTGEKQYLLDQYLVDGGRAMLLLESHRIIQPSQVQGLSEDENPIAVSARSGLDELLFHAGLRFKPGIISDMYATPIVVATGEGPDSQYNPLLWLYYPMVFPNTRHPVSANIPPLQLRYTGGWDTLPRPELHKTVLLRSSPLSRLESFPRSIDLQLAGQKPEPGLFEGKGDIPLGVLVEGDYESFYANKVRPLKLSNHRDSGSGVRLLVVADGDLIANQFNEQGKPLELGFDKWTSSFYGNKAFLINALHYLMDQEELLVSRSKSVSIPRLDQVRVNERLSYWQGFVLIWPLVLIALAAFLILRYRGRRFTRPLS